MMRGWISLVERKAGWRGYVGGAGEVGSDAKPRGMVVGRCVTVGSRFGHSTLSTPATRSTAIQPIKCVGKGRRE